MCKPTAYLILTAGATDWCCYVVQGNQPDQKTFLRNCSCLENTFLAKIRCTVPILIYIPSSSEPSFQSAVCKPLPARRFKGEQTVNKQGRQSPDYRLLTILLISYHNSIWLRQPKHSDFELCYDYCYYYYYPEKCWRLTVYFFHFGSRFTVHAMDEEDPLDFVPELPAKPNVSSRVNDKCKQARLCRSAIKKAAAARVQREQPQTEASAACSGTAWTDVPCVALAGRLFNFVTEWCSTTILCIGIDKPLAVTVSPIWFD